MSSYEFSEWIAFHQLEPFGEERADFRMAIIACTMANIHGRKKGRRAFKVEDFMPKFGKETLADKRQDPREMESILRGYALAQNRSIENLAKRVGKDPKGEEKKTPDDKLRPRPVQRPVMEVQRG